jgi:hypothetical protein
MDRPLLGELGATTEAGRIRMGVDFVDVDQRKEEIVFEMKS